MRARHRTWCKFVVSSNGILTLETVKRFLYEHVKNCLGSCKTLVRVANVLKLEAELRGLFWFSRPELASLARFERQLRLHDHSGRRVRKGLRYGMLLEILQTLNILDDFHLQCWCLLCILYDVGARLGEFLRGRSSDAHMPISAFVLDDVTKNVTVYLGSTKTDYDVSVLMVHREGQPCGAEAARMWHDRWGMRAHNPNTPFFFGLLANRARKIIKWAVARIGLDPRHFSGHSLRIGAATDAFMWGVPYPIIKKRFRWLSDAALKYFQDQEGVDATAAAASAKFFVSWANANGGGAKGLALGARLGK